MDDEGKTLTNTWAYREMWLHALAARMTKTLFEPAYEVPSNIRISCGFPSMRAFNGVKNQRIGECWGEDSSGDNHFEIFVSPVLGDEIVVASTLGHEMCHAVAGLKAKHGAAFKRVALHIGLEGKMTATTAGDQFKRVVQPMLEEIGPYPMAALDARKMTNGRKKQTARLLKCMCPMCNYTARVASKWIIEVGTPHCPEHGPMELEDKEVDE